MVSRPGYLDGYVPGPWMAKSRVHRWLSTGVPRWLSEWGKQAGVRGRGCDGRDAPRVATPGSNPRP
eukprot:1648228-Rhodomonas_salina.1